VCLGGAKGRAPFPASLSPLAASFLRFAPDRFLLTKSNTSCTMIRFVEAWPEKKEAAELAQHMGWSHLKEILCLNDPVQRG